MLHEQSIREKVWKRLIPDATNSEDLGHTIDVSQNKGQFMFNQNTIVPHPTMLLLNKLLLEELSNNGHDMGAYGVRNRVWVE